MASCDDDFGLLGNEVNQLHNHHHHHNQIDQQQQRQLSSFSPFSSSRHHSQQHQHHHCYIPVKGGTNGGVSVQSHPFLAGNNININHDNQCSESTAFAPQSDNHHRFTTTAEVDDDEDEDDGSAFAPQSPKSPQNVDDEEDDRNNYGNTVVNDASEDPVISSGKSHGGGGGLGLLGIDIVSTPPPSSRHNNHHQFAGRISSCSSSRQHPIITDLDPHLKRKDLQHHNQWEDHLSDGAKSPSSNYYSKKSRTTTTTTNNVMVTTNAAAAAAATTSSSMDYRKDREEWSDSAIACLLDAYTDKYLQLNKGNLRGRDWEDVAIIVSKRSEKHKSGKSVEQCKNKVDNLKKRYKVECQGNFTIFLDVSFVVLDEADRMLDMGFEPEVRSILKQTSSVRQMVMFSATWPFAVHQLAQEFMRPDPVKVVVGSQDLAANHDVMQIVEVLDDRSRDSRLIALLEKYHSSQKNRVLVFVLYKKEAARVESMLQRRGWNAVSVHGDKPQHAKTEALSLFKNGKCPLMIATDVASRGLDIPDVEVVINYSFPLTTEDYVHRIGRTGRAGKKGVAHTFFMQENKALAGELCNVLREAGQVIPESLTKFGTHVKKKESKLYGAHFKEITADAPKATKITFADSDDE